MLDERVDDCLRVFAIKLYQHHVARLTLDQGRDLAVATAKDQVAFPMPRQSCLGQCAVRNEFAALGAPRSAPRSCICLVRPVAVVPTIALDLPADCRWCSSQSCSDGPTPPRWLARSLLVGPASMRLRPELVGRDGFHLSRPGFDGSKSGRDQRACRSHATSSLASIAPKSARSGCPNSRFWVAASFAALLPPMRRLVCCSDRLNPPLMAALSGHSISAIQTITWPTA